MPFDFYHEFYGNYVGMQIRGTIGKKIIYQRIGNIQRRYNYFIPPNPNTPAQQHMRFLLGRATDKWHTLTEPEKQGFETLKPKHKVMSGFNYFVSLYIKQYL